MMSRLDSIQFVLVNPSHAGNIGAAARALKNMGLSRLTLVNPSAEIDGRARALASGAEDVLDNTRIVSSIADAVNNSHFVFATSSRERRIPWPITTPKQCVNKIQELEPETEIAIVFGRERTGLTNDELQLSQYHIWIPANPDYPSLNLAASVQVVAYELYQGLAGVNMPQKRSPGIRWATQQDLAYFYNHLETVLSDIGFLDRNNPKLLMQRLNRIFNRAQLDVHEVNILRGILSAMEKAKRDNDQ